MSVIRELAAFVCKASAASLPAEERATQWRHVADTWFASFAGHNTTEGKALRSLLRSPNTEDEIGMRAAVIRHTEIDDIHMRSCTTPSSVTVPTALLLARRFDDFDPVQVASAIWVGTELMTRLGMAIDGPRILYRGIWPTYFAAPLGAAAAAARMARLSEDQTAHALSLALMLTAGRAGRFQGKIPGRSVVLANAVAAGVRAAGVARHDVGGDPDLLDGPWLREAQGIDADISILTAGLGGRSVYPEMSLKPFCSAKQAIAAVEAVMTVIDEGIAPNAITKVRVRVPPPYARMISTKAEASARASTIVSAALQIGLAACCRERLYDIGREDVLRETEAVAFAEKVEIVADEKLLDVFPVCWPAEVEVSAGGNVIHKRITSALGDPERPLDDAGLVRKANHILGCENAASNEFGLGDLDDSASWRRLADAF
jgi:2-methylcitrate dehydratase PrpD